MVYGDKPVDGRGQPVSESRYFQTGGDGVFLVRSFATQIVKRPASNAARSPSSERCNSADGGQNATGGCR